MGRESPAPPSAGTYLPTLHTYIHTLLAVLRVCMLYVVYATHAALTRNLAGVSLSLSRSLGTCTFGYNMHRYLHIIHLGLWDRARGRGVHTLFSSQPANQPANQPTSQPASPPPPQAPKRWDPRFGPPRVAPTPSQCMRVAGGGGRVHLYVHMVWYLHTYHT